MPLHTHTLINTPPGGSLKIFGWIGCIGPSPVASGIGPWLCKIRPVRRAAALGAIVLAGVAAPAGAQPTALPNLNGKWTLSNERTQRAGP